MKLSPVIWTYSNDDGALVDGFDSQTSLDGSTRHLGANAHDTSWSPASVIVFVGVTGHPNWRG